MKALSFKQFVDFVETSTVNLQNLVKTSMANSGEFSYKDDNTRVTDLDLEIEKRIRGLIKGKFENHSISGEEYGEEYGSIDYNWTIDPIDGTFSYTNYVPLFGTLIGLEYKKKPLYGALRLPFPTNQLLVGDGKSAWMEGKQQNVSSCETWNDALILTTDEQSIAKSRYRDGWEKICSLGPSRRTWGDCYGYFLLCTGRAHLMFDINLKSCDILPLLPIIRGAGCKILELKKPYRDIIVYSPDLDKEIMSIMAILGK
ncbi:MAG: hypothetical protein CBC16_10370 [Verrucomicrobia bacterium TMED56]|jgi:histidinol-phosphatase|nr:MAG: hypothetical protein CBC16_10370 [Verrucomicrobia bacterium TMED56]|tara:strand:+ start:632 stop:1402 length:771 start_codon:yes stop_codon:yes gene_type:complete